MSLIAFRGIRISGKVFFFPFFLFLLKMDNREGNVKRIGIDFEAWAEPRNIRVYNEIKSQCRKLEFNFNLRLKNKIESKFKLEFKLEIYIYFFLLLLFNSV